jgi:hypothetical protein
MAQNYYSLQEAANILGKAPEDLVQMVRKGDLRGFSDAGSWKFRTQDIDEMKRTNDLLGDLELSETDANFDEDLLFADEPTPAPAAAPTFDDIPLASDPPAASPSDSTIARSLQGEKPGKGSGESDVRLIFTESDDGNDSGIALVPDFDGDEVGDATKPPTDSDIRLLLEEDPSDEIETSPTTPAASAPTEEFSLADDALGLSASDSGLIPLADDDDDLVLEPAPRQPGMSDATVEDSLSFEDELGMGLGLKKDEEINLADLDLEDIQLADRTPTVKQAAGDDDSDSDFDLNLDDDIGLAQDITPGAGDSGINLGRPDDSGILLKKAVDSGVNLKSGDTDSSDSEFDVSLESDDDIFDSNDLPSFKASDTAPRMSKVEEDSSDEISDSDFELALDGEGDEESGSDVVAVDDDEEEDESGDDFDGEDEEPADLEGEVVMANAQPAPWGGGWVFVLSLTTLVFVVVMMMMYEISRNAWSYHEPYPLTATIIETVYEGGKSVGVPLP